MQHKTKTKAIVRKTRAVKGPRTSPRTSTRSVVVEGTPNDGTYVDPLVVAESELDAIRGPEELDDPEDVYEGADDIGPGPFGNVRGQ